MIKEITVKGAVQGVGYRPFVAEKAREFNITGYVKNMGAQVQILAIGGDENTEAFVYCIKREVPYGAFLLSVTEKDVDEDAFSAAIKAGINEFGGLDQKDLYSDFYIIDSTDLDLSSEIPVFLPDIGICDDCMREMLDPNDRRYRYPLISCAVCGPRLSILDSFPYDRERTTMRDFDMCPSCKIEYDSGRRHYAQTISCHDCGPQMILRVYDENGTFSEAEKDAAVENAIRILSEGGIIGLKGISGYQLVCKPTAEAAKRLRLIKGRENKAFAIMFSDVDSIREYAYISELEEDLLKYSSRPIVLLQKRYDFDYEVVRDSRYIGAFLPSAGIHRLLTDALGPLIVTSANKSDQPMIYDDETFFETFLDRGDGVSGSFSAVLYHKRRINMAQDDSVMFVISDGEREYAQFIRRARGYAPLPIILNTDKLNSCKDVVLAFGGDLKSSFAFVHGDRILPSQYIGDLEDYETVINYRKLLNDYEELFKQKANRLVCDMHPLYFSHRIAEEMSEKSGVELISLQHHAAHIYSVMAENSLDSCIGVSFDGTGYGLDGNIWGSEFIAVNGAEYARKAHLSYVKLLGGDEASKDAAKVRDCYIHAAQNIGLIKDYNENDQRNTVILNSPNSLDKTISSETNRRESLESNRRVSLESNRRKLLYSALDNDIQTFKSSSMGRLFDAVSSLLGICDYNSYEGECAIKLEKAAWEFIESGAPDKVYPELTFKVIDNAKEDASDDGSEFIVDQLALFSDIFDCYNKGSYSVSAVAYAFHRAIVQIIKIICTKIRSELNENRVCLSGGVFNNRILLAETVSELKESGFNVYWNRELPLGDGCISAGQAYYCLLKE
jgi:hydrogenase maturation protein HypF